MSSRKAIILVLLILRGRMNAQQVLSAHAGLILFSEGKVTLQDRPVPSQSGRFLAIGEQTSLRTQDGRAEVLLAPGVFLWMTDHTEIRMLHNNLTRSSLELLRGSIVVTALTSADAQVSIESAQGSWTPQAGSYRLSADFWLADSGPLDAFDLWALQRGRAIAQLNTRLAAKAVEASSQPDRRRSKGIPGWVVPFPGLLH